MSPGTVAVTLGDPRGIGPAVARRAVTRLLTDDPGAHVVVFGPPEHLGGFPAEVERVAVTAWDGTEAGAGLTSVQALEGAVQRALAGTVGALVTAPVHKPALHQAGWTVPGQTEMLQELTGAASVGMLMAAESTRFDAPLRVLLATTHLPLRDVPDRLTTALLVEQATLLDRALRRDWGIAAPRLALCALNPHASDGGLFGDEEARIYAPAVRALRDAGVDVSPALPADTVFGRTLAGAFDAVVAPYHDVGMAAFKTVAFGRGVNVTIGLPFVRTSPDHGTAFDLAGTPDAADASSMVEALRLARWLVRNRFDTEEGRV